MNPVFHNNEELLVQISLINDFLYCPRRAALKQIEGWRQDNEHTLRGDIVHEHADLAGYEVIKGVKLLRALPVFSERLGINGKCDIVEVHAISGQPQQQTLIPVEFKLGKRRKFENDDAQLCAQAFCLEEMFHTTIQKGAIFHADSKRRREVELTPQLRQATESAIIAMRQLAESGQIPSATFKPQCEECSLYDICLPQISANPDKARTAAQRIFEVR